MTWLVRASPASATATPVTAGQAVRVQDSGSKRPIQRAEGWTRSAAVRRSRVSPPRGYTTVRVSAPARASRITSACMASSSLRERERRWRTTRSANCLICPKFGVVAYGEKPLALLCSAWPGVLLSLGSSVINDGVVAGHWTNAHKHFCPPRVAVRSRTAHLVRKDSKHASQLDRYFRQTKG